MYRWTGWIGAAAVVLAVGPLARADETRGAQRQGATERSVSEEVGERETPTPKTGVATTESGKAQQFRLDDKNAQVIKDLYAQSTLDLRTARLAIQKSQDREVQQFADRMARAHTRFNEKLEALANERGVPLSREEALTSGQRAHLEDMSRMSESEFAQHFGEMMVADHEKLLTQIRSALNQANVTGDLELAAVLQEAHGTVREQQQTAMTLGSGEQRGSMGAGSTGGTGSEAQDPAGAGSTGGTGTEAEDPTGAGDRPTGQRSGERPAEGGRR